MHLEYITSVVDLTEMYSKGNLWCVGGGGRGAGQVKTMTYCIRKLTFLREGHQSMRLVPWPLLDL